MAWSEFLDELEERLHAHERCLREGAPVPPALYVAPSLGPLPSELANRASELAGRMAGLEAAVALQRDVVSGILARHVHAERGGAVYVDKRA